MSQPIALVTGATGYQGGATARELVKAGFKVHALVRNPSSQSAIELQRLGVQLFPGDFDNIPAMKTAVEGATAVFLNVSPVLSDTQREVIYAKNVINTAIASGTVISLVYSSVTMTGKHESFPNWEPDNYSLAWYWLNKARIENMVRKSDIKYWTILRPAKLMNGYHQPMASFIYPSLAERRIFATVYKPDTAMTVLDHDVGKFAAAAIAEPVAYNMHEIDLGVETLTPAEVVRELSQFIGVEIGLEFHGEEEAKELALGAPRVYAELWANEVGYQVDFKELEKYPIRLTTFSEYLEKHRDDIQQTFK